MQARYLASVFRLRTKAESQLRPFARCPIEQLLDSLPLGSGFAESVLPCGKRVPFGGEVGSGIRQFTGNLLGNPARLFRHGMLFVLRIQQALQPRLQLLHAALVGLLRPVRRLSTQELLPLGAQGGIRRLLLFMHPFRLLLLLRQGGKEGS